MISNQILQSTIDGIKGIARVDLTVADVKTWFLHLLLLIFKL